MSMGLHINWDTHFGGPERWSMVLKHGPTDTLPQAADRIVTAVIGMLEQRGQRLSSTGRKRFVCEGNRWRRANAADEQWIRAAIQYGCRLADRRGHMDLANNAWRCLNKHPAIYSPGFDPTVQIGA